MDQRLVQVEDDGFLNEGMLGRGEGDLPLSELCFVDWGQGLDVLEGLQGLDQVVPVQF